MVDSEKWLHLYRKLDRSDPVKAFKSTNYTDPKLKLKRVLLLLLQRLHISESANDQLLQLLDHLVRVNEHNNKWDVLKSKCFLQIMTYAMLHIIESPKVLEEFVQGLFELQNKKTHVSSGNDEQAWLVNLLTWYLKSIGENNRAIALIR